MTKHKCKFYPTEEVESERDYLPRFGRTWIKPRDMWEEIKFIKEDYHRRFIRNRLWVCECGLVKWIEEKEVEEK